MAMVKLNLKIKYPRALALSILFSVCFTVALWLLKSYGGHVENSNSTMPWWI
jgi:hypothetical protein